MVHWLLAQSVGPTSTDALVSVATPESGRDDELPPPPVALEQAKENRMAHAKRSLDEWLNICVGEGLVIALSCDEDVEGGRTVRLSHVWHGRASPIKVRTLPSVMRAAIRLQTSRVTATRLKSLRVS